MGEKAGWVAVETHHIDAAADEHIVHFYEHDTELVGAVGPYLGDALRRGGVAVVIATERHRRAFEAALADDGIELAQARATGRFLALDAARTLGAFMRGGELDRTAFRRTIGSVMRTVSKQGRGVRAYGEMVALLWEEGNVLAAIELEERWNELAGELPFALLCAYAATSVTDAGHVDALERVCHLHSAVVSGVSVHGHGDRAAQHEIAASFPAVREAPGDARRLLVEALRERDCERASVEAAALVLSELASNAVLHAGCATFSVRAIVGHSTLRLIVEDAGGAGAAMPVHQSHGLGVVNALARAWGVATTPGGKLVWAELAL